LSQQGRKFTVPVWRLYLLRPSAGERRQVHRRSCIRPKHGGQAAGCPGHSQSAADGRPVDQLQCPTSSGACRACSARRRACRQYPMAAAIAQQTGYHPTAYRGWTERTADHVCGIAVPTGTRVEGHGGCRRGNDGCDPKYVDDLTDDTSVRGAQTTRDTARKGTWGYGLDHGPPPTPDAARIERSK